MAYATETLPLTVLTGFLGSGKTTLLQRAVATPAFSKTAVLVNEIGEIAFDHHLVETVSGPVIALPGGCLCCAMRADIASAIRDLFDRRAEGAVPPFQRIVIETTGLADPGPILFTLAAAGALNHLVRLAGVAATIDSTNAGLTISRYAEAARQVAVADRLLFTKTDLMKPDEQLLIGLARLNSTARQCDTRLQDAPTFLLSETQEVRAPSAAAVATHTHGIRSFVVRLDRPPSRLEFAKTIGQLLKERGDQLLRVKGIVQFADRLSNPAFIQGAQHAFYAPIWLDRWPDEDRGSRLVFIVDGVEPEEIVDRLSFIGLTVRRVAEPLTSVACNA